MLSEISAKLEHRAASGREAVDFLNAPRRCSALRTPKQVWQKFLSWFKRRRKFRDADDQFNQKMPAASGRKRLTFGFRRERQYKKPGEINQGHGTGR